MSELQLGLSEQELEKHTQEDPDLPWRPDFMVGADDLRNRFWIDKMVEAYMTKPEVSLVCFGSPTRQLTSIRS